MDAFGSGSSARSYLKSCPIDTLKSDRSLSSGLGQDNEDAAIVQALITFARALSLGVIAEGIETTEQLAHLQSLGCDCGQGYYFSRPLPADQMAELLPTSFDVRVVKDLARGLA